jgi:uncharacterized repeat protein (TIGR03803 family)
MSRCLFARIRVLTIVIVAILASCGPASAQVSVDILHDFGGGPDGAGPQAALTAATDGYLYGTTVNGGGGCASASGCGTIFRILPGGTDYAVVYAFGGGSDGAYALAGLLETTDGTFYGTTMQGGNRACGGRGCGTVFRMDPNGTVSVVHAFPGGEDGAEPWAGLIAGGEGNLYGTTFRGGGLECVRTVYAFTGGSDGRAPQAPLIAASDGNFYGTTYGCALFCGDGTVFQIDADGTFSTVYSFSGPDGSSPRAALIGNAGTFHGTTLAGGVSDKGVLFRLTVR